jgi:20S proteasome alpha/beta subunit
VTLIIGTICKDAIVMASDSQTTREGSKRTDAEKLLSLRFGTDRVLLGHAGNAGNSARAIEILSELAKDKPLDDYRMPADLARQAMIQLKHELKQQYCDCTVEQLREMIWKEELQSELMLAYYYKGKPYIFTVDLAVGRSDKEKSWYSAIGCGANLGSYLLSEHTQAGMNASVASCLAAYILETVCKHDSYCSPPVKIAVIINDLAAYAAGMTPQPQSTHPSVYGGGMVTISVVNKAHSMAKSVDRIIESERLNRNKKLERLLIREAEMGKRVVQDYLTAPTPKTFTIIKRRFAALRDMTLLEFFYDKDSPLGRAAAQVNKSHPANPVTTS